MIPNVSDYSDDIADESKTVEISYQITKDGYTTVNNKVTVTDAKGNIDVTMFAVAPKQLMYPLLRMATVRLKSIMRKLHHLRLTRAVKLPLGLLLMKALTLKK